ncbi:putative methyltransferase-like protein 4 [Cercophora samala]|uniref:Methyltransferase-like protein 4 n=1 Tax=Cercophora samala TaxID=330535 RepID=A0AA39ZJP5_9PEZI|nr:putative methyltransferase-like protein 4 [Cercophora samala]
MPESSILWQNEAKTVVLLDLPGSIEEAQYLSDKQILPGQGPTNTTTPFRRLISSPAPEQPFLTPEPKSSDHAKSATSPAAQIAELMTIASIESALDEIATSYQGPWCLPRITSRPADHDEPDEISKKPEGSATPPRDTPTGTEPHHPPKSVNDFTIITPSQIDTPDQSNHNPNPSPYIPPNSHPLTGPFPPLLPQTFSLILLDPPWPNRSAKRKRSGPANYTPLPSLSSTHTLLSSFPISTLLSPSGLLAVWVTNSPRFTSLLLNDIFPHNWGVELVAEWTWLKVTSSGEPIVDLGSQWRKPYERLLIARKRGGNGGGGGRGVKNKVIVSVPDIHSRKPNLKRVFEEEEGLLPRGYTALEMFARNLTAGWWGWGDEVVKFQGREYWVEEGAVAGELEGDLKDGAGPEGGLQEDAAGERTVPGEENTP